MHGEARGDTVDDGHDGVNEPGPTRSSSRPASNRWTWLWLLVPIAMLFGLFLWIVV